MSKSTVPGPRTRAAGALRELGQAFVAHQADAEMLERIAAVAVGLREELSTGGLNHRTIESELARLSEPLAPDGAALDHSDICPVSGRGNPVGLAMTVVRDGREAVGSVTLGPAAAGPPDLAHGGIVASLLDDIMGFVLDSLERTPGFTAYLKVTFRRPVAVGVPLTVRGRLRSREGRKLFIEGTVKDGGEVLAEGEALFVEPAQ